MGYKVILFSGALKDFEALPKEIKVRVGDALRLLALSPDLRGVKKLHLPFEGYRTRVGNYRVLFDLEGSTIFVHAITHRKDAYR